MYYAEFLDYLRKQKIDFFIEAEARLDRMNNFIEKYNEAYSPAIDLKTDGICQLGDVDKWGVELRIYLNNISNMPEYWADRKYTNKVFRAGEFAYRIDDSGLVYELFNNGYRIGNNKA